MLETIKIESKVPWSYDFFNIPCISVKIFSKKLNT